MKKYHNAFTMSLGQAPLPCVPESWRVLVTGVTSIHGWPIVQTLQQMLPRARLYGIRPPKMSVPSGESFEGLCVTDRLGLERIRREFKPTHIIYGSGLCDLDACEAMPEWARSINVGGPLAIAEIFGPTAHIHFISMDLVFSGHEPPLGGYTEDHEPDPVSVVGKTFAEAETMLRRLPRASILRLGLPTGASLTGDKGAIDFIESRFRRRLPLTLFYDERRSCIDTAEIGVAVAWLLASQATGLFHLGGDDTESLHGLGLEIIRQGNYPPDLLYRQSYREEIGGPPRVGDVGLCSGRIESYLRAAVHRSAGDLTG